MRAWLGVCAVTLFLGFGVALTATEGSGEAGLVMQDRADREARGSGAAESLLREEARRAEAEKRVEQIRNLPPERVQDWIDGKLTEADLGQMAEAPCVLREPDVVIAVPRSRLNRLVLVVAAALVLAFLCWKQRRPAPKKAGLRPRRPEARARA